PEPSTVVEAATPSHKPVLRRDDPTEASSDRWRKAVDAVRGALPRLGTSLAFGRLVALKPGEVRLSFPKQAAFHRATVLGSGKQMIEKFLATYFGRETQIGLEESPPEASEAQLSPAEQAAHDRAAYVQQTEESVRNDPAVRSALRLLGGEIEE